MPTAKQISESGVVIVGGTSGVGYATAAAFLAAGAPRVMIVGRRPERGEPARDALQQLAPDAQVEFHAADGNDPASAIATVEHGERLLDGIDVLVNTTAAAVVPELLHTIPVDEIPRILTQQCLAPLLMTRAVLPAMCGRQTGAIVNVASDAAKVATPGESVIGAAMAAIVSFTRTAAMEAKRDGVRINALTPSLIAGTPTTERVTGGGFSAKLFDRVGKMAALGVPTPEDQAELILFLSSPAAARLTGQAISLNGGVSAA